MKIIMEKYYYNKFGENHVKYSICVYLNIQFLKRNTVVFEIMSYVLRDNIFMGKVLT